MSRLPPKHFLVVFWGLSFSALAPGFFLTPESPHLLLRTLMAWFNTAAFMASVWQGFWFWRALQFACSHPALPQGAPDRVRKVQRLAWPLAPVYLAAFLLGFLPRDWLRAHAQTSGIVGILAVGGFATALTTFVIIATIARAIRDAEIAAASPIRRSAFSTFLQLVYLPFAAPFLRHRLEIIAAQPSELVVQPV